MSRVSVKELMEHALAHKYAVGYFESWNLESTLAVVRADSTIPFYTLSSFPAIKSGTAVLPSRFLQGFYRSIRIRFWI